MKISWLSFFLPFLYILLAGFVIASELYKRIYDRGNSEMAGLGSYLLTMPSSSLIDRIADSIFGVKIGDSDTSFTVILVLSAILNAILIYLVMLIILGLARRVSI